MTKAENRFSVEFARPTPSVLARQAEMLAHMQNKELDE